MASLWRMFAEHRRTTAIPLCTNVQSNPSFENGYAPWEVPFFLGSQPDVLEGNNPINDPLNAHSGNYYEQNSASGAYGPGVGVNQFANQETLSGLPLGAIYRFSINVQVVAPPTPGYSCTVYITTYAASATVYLLTGAATNTYTQLKGVFVANADPLNFGYAISCPALVAGQLITIDVDDITIRLCGQTNCIC